jgi:hypothetical protein
LPGWRTAPVLTQETTMIQRTLLAVALAAAAVWWAPAPAGAVSAPPQHCVVHVTGQKASGEMTVSAPRCHSTFAAAMAEVGLADFVLATHYDLPNFDASAGSTSTVGSSCTGGWLNTSAAWNNRIGSTRNGCPSVIHYDLANLGGASATTVGTGGNLGAMNNRTSSIQYS